jgi:hypothetical protein
VAAVAASVGVRGIQLLFIRKEPVGGEFAIKLRLGSEIGRNSAAAKRTGQAKH